MNLILIQPTFCAFDTSHNVQVIESLIKDSANLIGRDDLLVLPEHFAFVADDDSYLESVKKLSRLAGCTVVGGSRHRSANGTTINVGSVVDSQGREQGSYSKLRPYFDERRVVSPGDRVGEFEINGKNILILICADFWYSDIFLGVSKLPDVVLVPSLSVSRKPTPEYSRELWKHLAITRAYEFGVYVGISDWGENSRLPQYRTCGVGGFADPTRIKGNDLFRPISERGLSIFNLDFGALESFRADRRMRGFFWK